MARELKIPAEGGGWCGGGGQEARGGLAAAPVGHVLHAGDVLDEVDVVRVVVVLVHALAGGSLPLELPPLGRACITANKATA